MNKFNAGDKVKIVRTGFGFGKEHLGRIVTISKKGSSYMHGIDGYYIDEGFGNGARSSTCGEPSFELVLYPNAPHKHEELIIAWARGAEIQYEDCEEGTWEDVRKPGWFLKENYRIKPVDTRKDKLNAKLDELQSAMDAVKKEIGEL
jgi:hypothetical protein